MEKKLAKRIDHENNLLIKYEKRHKGERFIGVFKKAKITTETLKDPVIQYLLQSIESIPTEKLKTTGFRMEKKLYKSLSSIQ